MACIFSFQVVYFNLQLYSRHINCRGRLGGSPRQSRGLRARPRCRSLHLSASSWLRRRRRRRQTFAAVPAGGALHCGPCRPRRRRPPLPRLCLHCRHSNSTAGELLEACQIMCNAATWKKNRYLVSTMQISERWESLESRLMQSLQDSKTGECS